MIVESAFFVTFNLYSFVLDTWKEYKEYRRVNIGPYVDNVQSKRQTEICLFEGKGSQAKDEILIKKKKKKTNENDNKNSMIVYDRLG